MKPRLAEQRCRALTVGQNLATATMALFLLGLPSVVQAQFTFTTNNGSLTITGYAGPGGAVVIPSTTNGYAVTGIGEYAFAACTNLTIVTIPSSITNIGLAPFLDCAGLTNISVASGNSSYSSINGVLFNNPQDALVAYPVGLTNATYAIPLGFTNIGPYAFASCSNLTSVTIALYLINIGNFAFFKCTSLTSVTVSNVNIGVASFFDCASLTNVTITGVVGSSIGGLAFANCTNLTSIYFWGNAPPDDGTAFYGDPDTVVYYQPGTTGWAATFGGAPTVMEPTPASDFDYYTYNGSVTITRYNENAPAMVVIPGYINGYPVTSIGGTGPNYEAFQGSLITSVIIPNTVTNIGYEAFSDCINLASVAIPNSVTSIGYGAFESCDSLTNVAIPNGVTSIGYGAFADCINLTSVAIPNSVTSIGEFMFSDCSSLINITIPNSVTDIGFGAIEICTSLTHIVIPNSVTSIGAEAFDGCSSLTNIVIPNSVTSIGDGAFERCHGLTSAYFQGNAPPDDGIAFSGDRATVYYLPGTTGWGATFGGVPTALWYQPQPAVLSFEPSFGVRNQQFGFPVSWATNASVIVQACTNLANPTWIPLATNVLSNGTNYFSDAQWTNYPCRFYRVSGPQ